jgi:hypothetical protein
MLYSEFDEAAALAGRAERLGDRLGALDVRSDALNTLAVSTAGRDGDWTGSLRQALRLALSAGHHEAAARAYCNLCGLHLVHWQFTEFERYYTEGLAYCREHDLTSFGYFLQSQQVGRLERSGRWAEGTAMAGTILNEFRTPVDRPCLQSPYAVMLARRGEPGAWQHLDEAVAGADRRRDSDEIVRARLARAEAHLYESRPEDARREVELAHHACAARAGPWYRGAVAVWLRRTGSPYRVAEPIAEPYRRLLDGDHAGSAVAWHRLGAPYEAAMALVDAGDSGSLREASRIFTRLGARRMLATVDRRLRGDLVP